MDDKDTQAATEQPDASPKADAEVKGEQEKQDDDFNASLAEFDTAIKSSAEQSEQKANSETVSRAEYEALKQAVIQEQQNKDLKELVDGVRAAGNIDPSLLGDDDIIGILDRRAKKNPELRKAWDATADNPTARAKLVKILGVELGKQFKPKYDAAATEDHEAVATAVRRNGNKTSESPPPKFGDLSNKEYQDKVKKEFGYTPRV